MEISKITYPRIRVIADLSSHNREPANWGLVAKNIDGIILRLGYRGYGSGKLVKDTSYERFRAACLEYSIPYGVYFFPASVSVKEAIEEADFVAGIVGNDRLEFPIFADSEKAAPNGDGRSDKLTKKDRTTYLVAFCERLIELGYRSGIYASTSWFNTKLVDTELKAYPHWVAQYASQCKYKGKRCGWQYTNTGAVPGMLGNTDLSIWYC